jgi:hypothetical protein
MGLIILVMTSVGLEAPNSPNTEPPEKTHVGAHAGVSLAQAGGGDNEIRRWMQPPVEEPNAIQAAQGWCLAMHAVPPCPVQIAVPVGSCHPHARACVHGVQCSMPTKIRMPCTPFTVYAQSMP